MKQDSSVHDPAQNHPSESKGGSSKVLATAIRTRDRERAKLSSSGIDVARHGDGQYGDGYGDSHYGDYGDSAEDSDPIEK